MCHSSQGSCFGSVLKAFIEKSSIFSYQISYRYYFYTLDGHKTKKICELKSRSIARTNFQMFLCFLSCETFNCLILFTVMATSLEKVFTVCPICWEWMHFGKVPLFLENCSIFCHNILQRYVCITLEATKYEKDDILSSPRVIFDFLGPF